MLGLFTGFLSGSMLGLFTGSLSGSMLGLFTGFIEGIKLLCKCRNRVISICNNLILTNGLLPFTVEGLPTNGPHIERNFGPDKLIKSSSIIISLPQISTQYGFNLLRDTTLPVFSTNSSLIL